VGIADVQVSDGAYVRHLRVSQPHHSLFQIPRKHKGFAVNLVGSDTFCDTHGSDKRAVFDTRNGIFHLHKRVPKELAY